MGWSMHHTHTHNRWLRQTTAKSQRQSLSSFVDGDGSLCSITIGWSPPLPPSTRHWKTNLIWLFGFESSLKLTIGNKRLSLWKGSNTKIHDDHAIWSTTDAVDWWPSMPIKWFAIESSPMRLMNMKVGQPTRVVPHNPYRPQTYLGDVDRIRINGKPKRDGFFLGESNRLNQLPIKQ